MNFLFLEILFPSIFFTGCASPLPFRRDPSVLMMNLFGIRDLCYFVLLTFGNVILVSERHLFNQPSAVEAEVPNT